jgi:TldD protein
MTRKTFPVPAAPFLAALVLLAALPARPARAAAPDWVLKTLSQELERSRSSLRLQDYDAPYFISYTVRDTERQYVSGKFGALFQSQAFDNRTAQVDVRVGSYQLDSSEDAESFFNPRQKWVPNNLAPVDRSEAALRRVLWLLTDYRYKAALMSYLEVKGREVNDPKAREADSMSRQDPAKLLEDPAPLVFDRKAWEKDVRFVSASLLDYPEVFDSSVEASAVRLTRWIVNTEGTAVRTVDDYVQLLVVAVTRAEDGMLLQDTVTFYGRSAKDLPTRADAVKATRAMVERLVKMRKAPVLDPVSVPVLMSPEATGVFFHETVGHRLEGQRQSGEEEGRTFKGQVGQRILPESIDVVDDPTRVMAADVPLNGAYRIDDEGVPAQVAKLVVDGVLKGFLLSRKPVAGFDRSNGHGRSDGFQPAVGRMANLVVTGKTPVPHARMKELLLEEVRRQGKPFGVIIESIAGGSTNTSSYGFQAYKGMPRVAWRVDAATGDETLVRGFEIVGTPLASINKIVATSDRYGVFNGYCGAESGMVPVSTVAPDMLFAEIELQRSVEGTERPPVLPPPQVDGTPGDR